MNPYTEPNVCCICGKTFYGYGNNPYPLRDEGVCCNRCNVDVVIPERICGILGDREKIKELEKERIEKEKK